ncbi:MAG: Hsp20/alpha crystallin family protein [Candidatus Bipolaricaulota bacterium]|nr:Hsp20/alpha crystallin family protein [Candidatus Bipolaricaulota bacterium]MBS3792928.1 Hsp20/alpha crystallin family protein [Candidatus Bipolaricaulota bacterium]
MRRRAIRSFNRPNTTFLVNKLIKDISKNQGKNRRTGKGSQLGKTDIYEQDGTLHYEIELPGFDKEEITVKTRENKLLVIGEPEQRSEDEDRNYLARGRRQGTVKGSYPLPKGIDSAEALTARYENGVLDIAVPLPKAEEQTIEVEIN